MRREPLCTTVNRMHRRPGKRKDGFVERSAHESEAWLEQWREKVKARDKRRWHRLLATVEEGYRYDRVEAPRAPAGPGNDMAGADGRRRSEAPGSIGGRQGDLDQQGIHGETAADQNANGQWPVRTVQLTDHIQAER